MTITVEEVVHRTESRLAAWWSAWKYVAILGLLLVLSVWINITQWADHRAYVKNEKDRLELAASKAGLQVAAALAKQKPKDDKELQDAVGRIETRVNALQTKPRPPALPVQCAPGQKRMDDVNAGADN